MYFIDGHCDTLSEALDYKKSILKNDLQFSIEKANNLGGGIQVMACFVDPDYLKTENGGFHRCNNLLNKFKEYQNNVDKGILIKNRQDLINAVNSNNMKVILSIENGSAISSNLDNVNYFYNEGVRIMSVTWNDDNELGCGANTLNDTGLTKLGFEYVKKLNKLGIIIDISHLSEKSFWDVVKTSTKPIVATHSNAYEICNHQRNLKDNQIKAIANSGGMIGIVFYTDFLNKSKKADVKDIIEHIKYVRELVGIDYIGFGSDFDGMKVEQTAMNVEDISKLNNIKKELENQGFSSKEIEKIMWKNWYDFFAKNL